MELWRACSLVTSYNDPGDDFRFAVSGACSAVLVGETPDQEIAATVMVGHDGHRGWLYYVAVSPRYRAQRCGRQIVDAGEAWLRARNVPKVQLIVRETNPRAVSFYHRLGYDVAPRTLMAKWL